MMLEPTTNLASGDGRFWKAAKDEAHATAHATALSLEQFGSERLSALQLYRALYVDQPWSDSSELATSIGLTGSRDRIARKNVVAAGIDTMHSRIVKNRPRPWIVTVGGDWDSWNRARLCSLWLDGFFEHADVYEVGELCVLDGLIYGTGVAKIYEHDDFPQLERVYVGELWVDPREEAAMRVRTLYHIRGIDKEVLAEAYSDHEDAIMNAKAVAVDDGHGGVVQHLQVVEAWRLPLSKGKKGRHVICLDNVTLVDEEWDDDGFPFVFFFWRRDPQRFFGIGLAESLAGTQFDINELEATICEGYRRMVAAWLVPKGAIAPARMTNKYGVIWEYDPANGPPQFYTPPPVPADLLMRSGAQIESAFHLNGISQLSAAMMKPAGLNSGIALQNYQDVESERHVPAGRSHERYYCELAKKILRCADAIIKRRKKERAEGEGDEEAANDDGLLTMYGGKRTLRALEYASVMLDQKPYVVRVFPVSSLAQTPAARLQQVNDMWNMGVIQDRAAMLELLNFPDLDRYSERELSGHWEADEMIESAIEGERDLGKLLVHSYMDHPYLHRRAIQMRSIAVLRGAPDSALRALNHLITQADGFLAKAQAAAAAQAAAVSGAPAPGARPLGGPPAGAAPTMPPAAA